MRRFLSRLALRAATLAVRSFRRVCMLVVKSCFKSAGSKVRFNPFDHFDHSEIEIGDDVFIGSGAWFAGRKISIGSHVMFGPGVMIQAGAHQLRAVAGWMSEEKEMPREEVKGVTIQDNVWIAANVTLIDGAFVGEGSVIGAGSLVTGSIPPNSIAVGAPAKVIKPRLDEEGLRTYLAFRSGRKGEA